MANVEQLLGQIAGGMEALLAEIRGIRSQIDLLTLTSCGPNGVTIMGTPDNVPVPASGDGVQATAIAEALSSQHTLVRVTALGGEKKPVLITNRLIATSLSNVVDLVPYGTARLFLLSPGDKIFAVCQSESEAGSAIVIRTPIQELARSLRGAAEARGRQE